MIIPVGGDKEASLKGTPVQRDAFRGKVPRRGVTGIAQRLRGTAAVRQTVAHSRQKIEKAPINTV